MIKPILTIGRKEAGPLECLYLGEDADAALKLLDNPPKGIVEVAVYKRPDYFRRRFFTTEVQGPAIVAEANPAITGKFKKH